MKERSNKDRKEQQRNPGQKPQQPPMRKPGSKEEVGGGDYGERRRSGRGVEGEPSRERGNPNEDIE